MSARLLVASVAVAFSLARAAMAADVVHPNVLFILADDVGADRIAAYGEVPVPAKTPNLDGLAANGVIFRHAWAMPVCSPSRATALTGRHGFHTGIGWNITFDGTGSAIPEAGTAGLEEDEHFLPRMLQSAGYHSAAIGKWHMATIDGGGYQQPIRTGFELHSGAIVLGGYGGWTKNVANAWGATQVQETKYSVSVNVDDALRFIGHEGDAPWFVWLAPLAAHNPLHEPPAELLSRETQALIASGNATDPDLHRAMVEALDTEIGRLLAGIDPAVLAKTLIIFMADNGTQEDGIEEPVVVANAKGSLYEGGIRVPLIISGPGVVQPGRAVDALACSVDIYATVLDAAGVALPTSVPIDGRSLMPLLADPDAAPVRRFAYAEKFRPNGFATKTMHRRTIRDARFKLLQTLVPISASPNKLFDLQADPLESHDMLAEGAPPLDPDQQAAFDALLAALAETDG
ncbi:MAG: sulfatase-like hydrolase/transferase [Planctomycetes bacterium]|nr:sulfatase-like hydrolase/transferase [Planctomycetota bacterium]